jgi:Domain of unknown function (DUF1816)
MSLSDNVKDMFTVLLEQVGVAVWVEVVTESPRCTYYFGPFSSFPEAEAAVAGYKEDLEAEGAVVVGLVTRRCKPESLTIYDEAVDLKVNHAPKLSSQRFSSAG